MVMRTMILEVFMFVSDFIGRVSDVRGHVYVGQVVGADS